MGKYDSSKSRVNPLLKYLKDNGKINDFLKFILEKNDVHFDCGKILNLNTDIKYDCVGEKIYKPLKSRLIYLVSNFNASTIPSSSRSRLKGKRLELSTSMENAQIRNEAVSIIDEKYDEIGELPKNGANWTWAILEGSTHPDIFIETTNAYFIAEAKRTEKGPTKATTWCNNRDQLIRHIEPLINSGKRVFYFYIWEKGERHYRTNDNEYLEYFDILSNKDRFINFLKSQLVLEVHPKIDEVVNSFLGYFNWDEINQLFNYKINYFDEI